MIFPLFDNCIMILLSLLTAFQTDFPELLIIAAGIFVVVITADSMGIRLFRAVTGSVSGEVCSGR